MKILVFGATGATGKLIVAQGLSIGHFVSAFGRNSTSLRISNDHFNFVQGDALNREQVEKAILGYDVIMSALGGPNKDRGAVLESQKIYHATRNIVDSMEEYKVQRLIFISAWDVSAARIRFPISFALSLFRSSLRVNMMTRKKRRK